MNNKEIDKNIKSYSKYYRNALINENVNDIEKCMASYEARLKRMYNSEEYEKELMVREIAGDVTTVPPG